MKTEHYKTPKQILMLHPEIAAAGYLCSDIGMLYRLAVVKGYRISKELAVNEDDVIVWFKNRKK